MEQREKYLMERALYGLIVAADRFITLLNQELNREGVTVDDVIRLNSFMSAIHHVMACFEKGYRILNAADPDTYPE